MLLHLKSPASQLFTQPFIGVQIKEKIKALCHWPLWGEFTGDTGIHHLMMLSWIKGLWSPPQDRIHISWVNEWCWAYWYHKHYLMDHFQFCDAYPSPPFAGVDQCPRHLISSSTARWKDCLDGQPGLLGCVETLAAVWGHILQCHGK